MKKTIYAILIVSMSLLFYSCGEKPAAPVEKEAEVKKEEAKGTMKKTEKPKLRFSDEDINGKK